MQWVEVFSDKYIIGFILLFFRFTSLFMLTPIFSHTTVPEVIKVSMALFFTIVFYPSMPNVSIDINTTTVVIAILSEILFGVAVGLILQIAFNVISFAGGLVSFVMGFSMASAIDPQSGISVPIISQFLSLLALMMLFTLDMHHWILLFVDESLRSVPMGGFLVNENFFKYTLKATTNMFIVGFMIAFPIVALGWLSDVIFGMLMKTMPQFNLLVIGYPIKIVVSLIVIMVTLSATMMILKDQMLDAFNFLEMFF